MTIGTTNQTQLSFIKEVTPGVTPATPAMQILRMTSESLKYTNQTVTSEEITTTRDIPDLILVDQANGGDMPIEFSALTYDEFLLAVLQSDAAFSAEALAATTIAADATGFTDSGSGFVSEGFEVGQFIEVGGFADSTINRIYRIVTVAAGVMTTFPIPANTEAVGASVTIDGSTAKNGTTDRSYTVQKSFLDVATPSYVNFRGIRVSTFAMDLAVGSKVTGSFGFMGMTSEVTESQIAGLTEVAKTTTNIMNAVSDVTDITAVGTGIATSIKFTDLNLVYDNVLRELKAIGTLGAIDIRAGTIDAKCTINPYFEDIELLTAFLANTEFSLSWQLVSDDGFTYIFSMPSVKFITQDLEAGSRDGDLIINSQVQAILDVASSSSMRIDKFAP